MKEIIKQFIPPILLSRLRRMKEMNDKPSNEYIGDNGRPSIILSDSSYQIDFKRVEVSSEFYFVPIFAMHRPASQKILNGKYYEPFTHELVRALLEKRPGNLIHAGTFFGDMLPSFSKSCPGTVYAFEPVLENFILSSLCIQKNNLPNILLLNAGLGNEISVSHIDTREETGLHRGGSSQIGNVGQITSLVRIDTFGLKDISVIQLDVEGFELEVLRGGVNTITSCKPTILIEDNSNNCQTFLKKFGYINIGSVPGLTVWTDMQNESVDKKILKGI